MMTGLRALLLSLVLLPLVALADDDTGLASAIDDERQRPMATPLDRRLFLAGPALTQVQLSPDGRWIAMLRKTQTGQSLWLLGLDSNTPVRALVQTDAQRLVWSHDGRWLFLQSPRQLFAMGMATGQDSRVVAAFDRRYRYEVLGADPSRPDALLVLEQTLPSARLPRSRVLRIDASGQLAVLHSDNLSIGDAALSADGKILAMRRLDANRHTLLLRDANGRVEPAGDCLPLERCGLIAVRANGDLLLLSNRGENFTGLHEMARGGTTLVRHVDPFGEADLAGIVLNPDSGEPMYANYRGTVARTHPLSASAAMHLERIQQQLPGRELQLQVGRESWLVGEFDGALAAPRWFRYRPSHGRLASVLGALTADESALSGAELARKIPVSWRASDGMRLHGYLSLPPGRDPKSLPLVTSVHGGPWSAVGPEYSGMTQFLVNRGFAVFSPNFRGSTGLGRDYLLAAGGDFGNGRVQQDIVEGTRFVLAQGVGDPERVAIQGASFGGYSALLGVTHTPELFRVGLAAVPPTDFGWTSRWALSHSDLSETSGMPLALTFKALGVDTDDATAMAALHAQSPLANAAQLARPVLLFAGGRDERVAIRSVTHYAAVLRRLGKDVTVYIEADAGHAMDADASREAYLYLVERLLHEHLGTAAPTPPDAALRAQLDRHLRP